MEKNKLNRQFVTLLSSLFVLLAMITMSSNAYSKQIHPLDDIADTAYDFIADQFIDSNEDIQIITHQLDRRLRLNLCEIPLEAFSPGYALRQGRSTVGVRCNGKVPWSLYVPVTIKSFREVAVLTQAVVLNTVLTEKDISYEKYDINRLQSGFFERSDPLIGKILARSMAKGAVITKHLIKTPMAVKRGQSVTLIARNSVIEVRMTGKAMSKGAIGERIKVKNMKTKRIVEGVIIDKHLISVNL